MSSPFATNEPEIKRDSWGRYRLTDPDDPKQTVKSWTRVTTFAKALDDTSNLSKWLCRMTIKGLVTDEALIVKTEDTDIDDRRGLDRIVEQAKEKAGANDAAANGTAIHTLTEKIDRGEKKVRVPAKWKRHIDGYKRLKDESGLEFPAELIERVVVVPELGVAGTFDRVCFVKEDTTVQVNGKTVHLRKGEAVVGDIKSNKSLDYAQVSIATQLAIYSRAKYMWNLYTEQWEPLPELNKQVGFIFHLPSTTGDAALYAIDLEAGWAFAQLCKTVREVRSQKKLVQQITTGDVFEADDEWEFRISQARTVAELSAIWAEANQLGVWNSQLERLGKQRMREI